MTRGNARELAVHLIYAREFTGDEPQKVVADRLDKEYYANLADENQVYTDRPSKAQVAYLDCVVSGVANRSDELNEKIQQHSIGWDVSRISKLARTIMQLAIFEILYMDEVPDAAAINEAVELSKGYDEAETVSFVNGILGGFMRDRETEAE